MYYVNGEYVRNDEAKLSIVDLAVVRGFAVFDYLRTYGGHPFHLQDHLLRLKYSCEQIGLELPCALEEIDATVHTTLSKNQLSEASIKIMVTGGISDDQFTPSGKSSLIVMVYPLGNYPVNCFTDGIKVVTTRLARSFPTSKTTQYMPAIVAMRAGKAQGATEALYLNAENGILEATTSNFFAFKKGVLYTCASAEVLFGITREVIMRLCAPHFRIEQRALRCDEIAEMEEAFITASNKEVMPVVQIDSMKVGNGLVGTNTKRIMELFAGYVASGDWPVLNIARYR